MYTFCHDCLWAGELLKKKKFLGRELVIFIGLLQHEQKKCPRTALVIFMGLHQKEIFPHLTSCQLLHMSPSTETYYVKSMTHAHMFEAFVQKHHWWPYAALLLAVWPLILKCAALLF